MLSRFLADVVKADNADEQDDGATKGLVPLYVWLDTGRIRSAELLQTYNIWADVNGERRLNSGGFYSLVECSSNPKIKNVTGHGNRRWVKGLAPVVGDA